MTDDPYVRDGRVIIRSSVETPYGTDEAYYAVSSVTWFAMTDDEQEQFCADIAIEHQNNVASCGASLVPWSEAPCREDVMSYD